MSQIFISYSGYDEDEAFAIADWLNSNGWPNLQMGQSPIWKEAEQLDVPKQFEAIASRCEAVLFIITPDWVESEWCRAQFDLFSSLNKPMVGLLTKTVAADFIPRDFTEEWQLLDFCKTDIQSAIAHSQEGLADNSFDELNKFLINASLEPDYLRWPPDSKPSRLPFFGLSSYERTDGGIFFGRDQQISESIDAARKLRKLGGFQFLLLSGPAGIGKSSLMHAGLLSRLETEEQHFIVVPPLEPATGAIHGESGLLRAIATTLAKFGLPDHPQRLAHALAQTKRGEDQPSQKAAESKDGIIGLFKEIIDVCSRADRLFSPENPIAQCKPNPPSIVLAIDHLADLYSQGDVQQNLDLLRVINSFAEQNRLSILLVATLHSGQVRKTIRHLVPSNCTPVEICVPPMPVAAYPQILQRPLERHSQPMMKLELEGPLIEYILNDVEEDQSEHTLTKVSLTLQTLFDQKTDAGKLTLETYEQLGGIEGVLSHYFEKLKSEAVIVSPHVHHDEKQLSDGLIPWFFRYDELSSSLQKRANTWSQLPETFHSISERMLALGLLEKTSTTQSNDNGQTLICEEAVRAVNGLTIADWSPLEPWIKNQFPVLELIERLDRKAREWVGKEMIVDRLWHKDNALIEAESISHHPQLRNYFSSFHLNYLQSCREHLNQVLNNQVERQQRVTGWMHAATLVSLMMFLLTVGFAYDRSRETDLAFLQRQQAESERKTETEKAREAEKQRKKAEQQMQLAQQSEQQTKRHLQQSITNLAQSILSKTSSPSFQGSTQLESNLLLEAAHLLQKADTGDGLLEKATQRLAALAAKDRLLAVIDNGETFEDAKFSPDGSRILTLSREQNPKIWDALTGVLLHELRGHTSTVNSAVFSPNSATVVTGSFDATARVWDVRSGRELSVLSGHALSVGQVAVSPNGKLVTTASLDSTAAIWDIETGVLLYRLIGHSDNINHVTFSHDGRLVATASNGIKLWNSANGQLISTLEGHSESVNRAEFSPDDQLLVTASDDGTARIWQTKTGSMLGTLTHGGGPMKMASFRPDGKAVITVAGDDAPKLWDPFTFALVATLNGHSAEATLARFNHRGNLIASASLDRTVRLWDGFTGQPIAELPEQKASITATSFSTDGHKVITASDGIRVWNARRTLLSDTKHKLSDYRKNLVYASDRQLVSLSDQEREKYHVSKKLLGANEPATNACDAFDFDELLEQENGQAASIEQLNKSSKEAIAACEAEMLTNPDLPHFIYKTGLAYHAAKNFELAQQYYEKAAKSAHTRALFSLADLMQKTAKTRAETAAALTTYQSALDAGYALAAFRIGGIYWDGEGVAENRDKAVAAWQEGAKLNDPSSHFRLGQLYSVGNLIERNPLATRQLERAAGHFSSAAKYHATAGSHKKAELARNRRGTIVRLLGRAGFDKLAALKTDKQN